MRACEVVLDANLDDFGLEMTKMVKVLYLREYFE